MSEISQKEVDEFILDLAKSHSEYSMEQFQSDFKAVISRGASFADVRAFQKAVNSLGKGGGASSSTSSPSSSSTAALSTDTGRTAGPKATVEIVSFDGLQSLVIDMGSYEIKAGLSGGRSPQAMFPSICRPQYLMNMGFKPSAPKYMTPLEDMEKFLGLCPAIWKETFAKCAAQPDTHPVLLTDAILTPKVQREKMAEIMFEQFGVPALYVGNQSKLSIYATGEKIGVVLNCGANFTEVTPICNSVGAESIFADRRSHVGGNHVTEWLVGDLRARGYSFADKSKDDLETLNTIKENATYVALDFNAETNTTQTSSSLDRTYTVPDGTTVYHLGAEQFNAPEVLFQPGRYHGTCDERGVSEVVYGSIYSYNEKTRRDLFSHIILAGGSTLFKGFEDRLVKELTSLAPNNTNIKIIALPERKLLPWIGSSVFASISAFKESLVTKKEYSENGPKFVHKKWTL